MALFLCVPSNRIINMDILFQKWVAMVDFPAVILLMLTMMGGYVMYKTQKNPSNNFDFADMLRDEKGKPSALRLAIFVCLGISSWVVMYLVTTTKAIDTWIVLGYMVIWSGAKVAEKLVDAYSGTVQKPSSSVITDQDK